MNEGERGEEGGREGGGREEGEEGERGEITKSSQEREGGRSKLTE